MEVKRVPKKVGGGIQAKLDVKDWIVNRIGGTWSDELVEGLVLQGC